MSKLLNSATTQRVNSPTFGMMGKLSLGGGPINEAREEYKNNYGVFNKNYNSNSLSYSNLNNA